MPLAQAATVAVPVNQRAPARERFRPLGVP